MYIRSLLCVGVCIVYTLSGSSEERTNSARIGQDCVGQLKDRLINTNPARQHWVLHGSAALVGLLTVEQHAGIIQALCMHAITHDVSGDALELLLQSYMPKLDRNQLGTPVLHALQYLKDDIFGQLLNTISPSIDSDLLDSAITCNQPGKARIVLQRGISQEISDHAKEAIEQQRLLIIPLLLAYDINKECRKPVDTTAYVTAVTKRNHYSAQKVQNIADILTELLHAELFLRDVTDNKQNLGEAEIKDMTTACLKDITQLHTQLIRANNA